MRGEDLVISATTEASIGSPPHARGRRQRHQGMLQLDLDHPRMRGEDLDVTAHQLRHYGSPPHARGRLDEDKITQEVRRITPACAGKTPTPTNPTQPSPDHPRMRGEDFGPAFFCTLPSGSPPHARGRPRPPADSCPRGGITPACAGKTRRGHAHSHPTRDHPRMRGEDRGLSLADPRVLGSPPHARGRLAGLRGHDRKVGITPACAGKTPGRTSGKPPPPDHPRMRGEDAGVAVGVDPFGWITPACAGKTAS